MMKDKLIKIIILGVLIIGLVVMVWLPSLHFDDGGTVKSIYEFEAKVQNMQDDKLYLEYSGQEIIGAINENTNVHYKVLDTNGDIAYLPARLSDLQPDALVLVRTTANPYKNKTLFLDKIIIVIKQTS